MQQEPGRSSISKRVSKGSSVTHRQKQRAGQKCKHPHRDDTARESPGGNQAVIREVYKGKKELPAVLGANASGLLDENAGLISSLFQDS